MIPRDHATEDARRAYEGLRRRPPRRALPGAIAADAKDQSLEPGELARFVGVLVILGGIALAAWWFELGPRTRRITDGLPLLMGLTLWDLIAASAWLVAGHLALAYLPLALALLDAMLGRQTETTDTRYVAATLGRYALLIVAYGGALLSLNISPTNIAWLVTALSVGIGFGLQEIVANFISGIILLLERPVRVGDWVTIGSHTGIVQRINIRATVIQNFDRQVIVLPNKALITGEVNNWTLGDRMMRRTFLVGLAYGSDVGRFLQVVQELLDAHPDIATDPAPYVTFERFADSCLEFRVRFLAEVTLAVQVVSELHDMIHRRLGEEDITIAFPQLDLHIKGPLPESNR